MGNVVFLDLKNEKSHSRVSRKQQGTVLPCRIWAFNFSFPYSERTNESCVLTMVFPAESVSNVASGALPTNFPPYLQLEQRVTIYGKKFAFYPRLVVVIILLIIVTTNDMKTFLCAWVGWWIDGRVSRQARPSGPTRSGIHQSAFALHSSVDFKAHTHVLRVASWSRTKLCQWDTFRLCLLVAEAKIYTRRTKTAAYHTTISFFFVSRFIFYFLGT